MHISVHVSESYFKLYTSSDICPVYINGAICISKAMSLFNHTVKQQSLPKIALCEPETL